MSNVFKKMSDSEILASIRSNTMLFDNPEQLMTDIKNVSESDEHFSPMEGRLMKAIEKIIKN